MSPTLVLLWSFFSSRFEVFYPLGGDPQLLLQLVDVAHEQAETVGLVERLLLVVGQVIRRFAAAARSNAYPVRQMRGDEVQHFECLVIAERENLMPSFDLEGVILPLHFYLLFSGLQRDTRLPDRFGTVIVTLDKRLAVITDVGLQETSVGVPSSLEVAIDVLPVILIGIVLLKAELFEQFVRLRKQLLQQRIAVCERLLHLQIDD